MLSLRTALHTALGAGALSLLALAGTAQAQPMPAYANPAGAYVNVQFGAPPPMRREAVPAPRHGYLWVSGYWEPRGHRHVWRPGHWVRARPGYVYRQPNWAQHGGRWDWNPGRWDQGPQGPYRPHRY